MCFRLKYGTLSQFCYDKHENSFILFVAFTYPLQCHWTYQYQTYMSSLQGYFLGKQLEINFSGCIVRGIETYRAVFSLKERWKFHDQVDNVRK
jgi:hypothetical protein